MARMTTKRRNARQAAVRARVMMLATVRRKKNARLVAARVRLMMLVTVRRKRNARRAAVRAPAVTAIARTKSQSQRRTRRGRLVVARVRRRISTMRQEDSSQTSRTTAAMQISGRVAWERSSTPTTTARRGGGRAAAADRLRASGGAARLRICTDGQVHSVARATEHQAAAGRAAETNLRTTRGRRSRAAAMRVPVLVLLGRARAARVTSSLRPKAVRIRA